MAKSPVIIPQPRTTKMYRDLGQFYIDPRREPSERFRLLAKDGQIDASVTPEVREKLFPRDRAQREKVLEIGLLACPKRDYASIIRKNSEAMLAKHGYRFGGFGGFLGFFLACPHVTCPGRVLALGHDMSRSRDIMLGIQNCSHERWDTRKVIAERLSELGKDMSTLFAKPIFIIIVKDLN